ARIPADRNGQPGEFRISRQPTHGAAHHAAWRDAAPVLDAGLAAAGGDRGRGCPGPPRAEAPRRYHAPDSRCDGPPMLPESDLLPQPLERARALPARCYVDPDSVERDRSLVFARSWQ